MVVNMIAIRHSGRRGRVVSLATVFAWPTGTTRHDACGRAVNVLVTPHGTGSVSACPATAERATVA